MDLSDQQLVDLIYAAAFDTSAWVGLIAQLTRRTGAHVGLLQSPPMFRQAHGFAGYITYNVDIDEAVRSSAFYAADDCFSGPIAQALGGRWDCVASGLRSSDPEALSRNPFWMEHCAAFDFGDMAALLLHEPRGADWPVLTMVRQRSKGAFEDADLIRFQAFASHLRFATRLRFETSQGGDADPAIAGTLDNLSTPCMLLGGAGQVLVANRAAETLVAEGGTLALLGKKLVALATDADCALQRAIHRAADGRLGRTRIGSEVVLPTPDFHSVVALVTPLGGENPFTEDIGPVRAAVYLLDPRRRSDPRTAQRRLRQMFGLSHAEAEVAADLLAGETPEDIADARVRSVHTVRAQVRSILAKADLRRIGELQALGALTAPPTPAE